MDADNTRHYRPRLRPCPHRQCRLMPSQHTQPLNPQSESSTIPSTRSLPLPPLRPILQPQPPGPPFPALPQQPRTRTRRLQAGIPIPEAHLHQRITQPRNRNQQRAPRKQEPQNTQTDLQSPTTGVFGGIVGEEGRACFFEQDEGQLREEEKGDLHGGGRAPGGRREDPVVEPGEEEGVD